MQNRSASLLAALLVAPLLAACQPAENGGMSAAAVDTVAIMTTLDSVRQAYADAYNAGDSAAIASMYARDAVFLPSTGAPITGRTAISAAIAQGMDQSQDFVIRPADTRILAPDVVVDYGSVQNTITPAGGDSAQTQEQGYMVVLTRTASGWKLLRAANTLRQAPGGGGGE